MKSIFTYPNNAGTHYINPNYVGDASVGFQKRIQDVIDGNIVNWSGFTPPVNDVDTIMENISKFNQFYDEAGRPGIGLYDFCEWPLTVAEVNYLGHLMDITESGGVYTVTIDDTSSFSDSEEVKMFNTTGGLSWPKPVYIDVISGTQIGLYNDSGLTDPLLTGEGTVIYSSNIFFIKNGTGVKAYTYTSNDFEDGDSFRLSHNFTEVGDTGTLNDINTDFYVNGSTGTEFEIYTDPGYSTPATLDETYYASAVTPYPSIIAPNTTFDVWSTNSTILTRVVNDFLAGIGPTPVRAWVSSVGGGGIWSSTDGLTTSLSTSPLFWAKYETDTPAGAPGSTPRAQLYVDRACTNRVQITVDQYSQANITINTINPARMSPAGFAYTALGAFILGGDYSVVKIGQWNSSIEQPYCTVTNIDLLIPSNKQFTYQNSGGSYVYGAGLGDYCYLPGATGLTILNTLLKDSDPLNRPDLTFNKNAGNNGIASITINDGGLFVYPNSVKINIDPLPSEYVPPAPTPADIAGWEDDFDLNAQWDTTSDYSAGKTWPLIPYKSIKVKMNQPSVKTMSQSGIKYIRSGGYARWNMEVEYPPLTEEQFNEILTASHLARGQAAVFEFFFKDFYNEPSNWWEWRHWQPKTGYDGVSTVSPTIQRWVDERTVLLEGYTSNESNPIPEGQLIGVGISRNGGVALAVNSNDANVYGELAVRVAYNDFRYKGNPGDQIWSTPDRITVSLGSDELNYTLGADGYYYVTVSFDLDFWK
jgi:hypothetical protein